MQDMVWYQNSSHGEVVPTGDNDIHELFEHLLHTLHPWGVRGAVEGSEEALNYTKVGSQYPHDANDSSWKTSELYLAMKEAIDNGVFDPSGYTPDPLNDPEQFHPAATEYTYILNFSMWEMGKEFWTDKVNGEGALEGEWSVTASDPVGVLSENPLGHALFMKYFDPVLSKPDFTTLRSMFQDNDQGLSNYVANYVDDAGVTAVDVALKFDPTHASFTSFSFADGLLGAANEASAADGTITFGAIALTPVSTDKPLFTMTMADLDSANDFSVTVSDLNVDGSALEGSVLLVGSPSSHAVTASVVTRDGSTISDVDVVMSDGTNSSSYKSAADGSVSGELVSGSASTVTGSLAYSSSTKAISSQDALDALKLSVGMTTSAGTKTAFDFISADFNQDGKVSSQDALAILKNAVGLPTTEQAEWVFVDTNGDYSGVSKSNTSYTEGVSIADLTADTSVGLTGILIGDVNDSYSGLIA